VSNHTIRVGLINAIPEVWALEANWCTFEDLATQAAEQGAQLICTPECFLDGYVVEQDEEGWTEERFRSISQSLEGNNYLRRARDFARQHQVHLVFGFTELAESGSYNSAALINDQGELLGCYHKTHLMSHDAVRFLPGQELPTWETDLCKIGIMICMDRNFPEVARTLKIRGAEVIMVPAYGGWSLANEWKVRTRACDNECFVCFVHPRVAFIATPEGELAAKLDSEEPDVLIHHLDPSTIADAEVKFPHRRPDLYEN